MREDEADGTLLAAPTSPLHSDPHDFAGLYIRHRSAFTLHARHYLRDARDAEEVVQEAFLRLFLALPELETELQALAYCRRTITNLCIDRYRTSARRPRLVDIGSIPLEELPDEDPGDPVVRAEDAALVREALSLLTPLHRAALVKREIEEKPLPVIAEELEVPEESVKHLLFRARRSLRRVLAGTSLAPGGDGEGGVGLVARAGSGGLAAFLLLLVLGLGSGPNLQAVPVVGVDLPAILPVTEIAKSVGGAVSDAVDAVSSPGDADRSPSELSGGEPGEEPMVAVDPSGSPTPSPSGEPAPVVSRPTASPTTAVSPAPDAPAPTKSAGTATSSASASPAESGSPSPSGTGAPEPTTAPQPSEPGESASPSASPIRSPSSSPSPTPSAHAELPTKADPAPVGRLLEGTDTASGGAPSAAAARVATPGAAGSDG